MKSLKNHISLIIPLFAILFAVEFYLIVDRLIGDYEKRLSEDYSIIVVSKKTMTLADFQSVDSSIVAIKQIDPQIVINRLKQNGVKIDYAELKNFLPKFYKIFLERFPSTEQLRTLQRRLAREDGVVRVEAFTKNHERIYRFLLFVKNIAKLFLGIIFITSVMLVFKQIEVWNLEHQERMYIMELFGAPLWMRNAILVKLSFIDTIISVALVYGLYLYLAMSGTATKLLGIEDLAIDTQAIAYDTLWLFGIGLAISIVNILIVSSKKHRLT